MSLPRGFGGQKQHSGIHYGPVVPPPRSDSMHALKSMMARRHKIRVSSKQQFRCLKDDAIDAIPDHPLELNFTSPRLIFVFYGYDFISSRLHTFLLILFSILHFFLRSIAV